MAPLILFLFLVSAGSQKASAQLPRRSRSGAAQNPRVMATAAATAPHPTPPTPLQQQQHQQHKEQQQKALSVNAIRLQAIGGRLKAHLRGMNVPPMAEFAHLIYAFARCASAPPLAIPSFLGFPPLQRPPSPAPFESPLWLGFYACRAVHRRPTHISCFAHAEGLTSRSQLVIFLRWPVTYPTF